jgi:hypothetical protein
MPYIAEEDRMPVEAIASFGFVPDLSKGELNYLLTKTILSWLTETVNYDGIVDVVGTLECVKQEFYRRVASPYEDMKRDLNGEVYL